jgi:hypothetical protein
MTDGFDIVSSHVSNVRTHKRGLSNHCCELLAILQYLMSDQPILCHQVIMHIIVFIEGKRNILKTAVTYNMLTQRERTVYDEIRNQLNQTTRRKRVEQFMNNPKITRRLINYFVIHYITEETHVAYYLDRRTYPHKFIGEFNQPYNTNILELIEKGANIIWVDLYHEYKTSKCKKGSRDLYSPYARSLSVIGHDNYKVYSLCELNFYIWLDDIGGFEAFKTFESDVRTKKFKHDEKRRNVLKRKKLMEPFMPSLPSKRSSYKSFLIQYEKPPPHIPFSTLQEYSNQPP